MTASDWRLEGEWMKNCTCAFGCPCDFNARPTQGYCKGLVAMRIAKGHFEGTRLDGLCFAITVDFPGPLHEGNGTIQPIIDERATAEQRQALFDIFSGKHSAEGTLFQIVSMIVTASRWSCPKGSNIGRPRSHPPTSARPARSGSRPALRIARSPMSCRRLRALRHDAALTPTQDLGVSSSSLWTSRCRSARYSNTCSTATG